MQTSDTDGDWAELVTDGHVRAARLRFMQPWLIAIGVGALLIGFYLWIGVTVPDDSREVDATATEVEAVRAPVDAALSKLPPINVSPDAARKLPNASEISAALVPMILAELKKSDRLPTDSLQVKALLSNDFWSKPWPDGMLAVTGNDDLKVIGGIVNTSPPDSWPSAGRWLGMFSKRGGTWRYATAEGPGFVDVNGQPSVGLTSIPLTIAPALPKER